ncbi:MAG TPA: RNase adapter RapZ, partial [Bryobacteraceae bacterium]|nr:RNase adapter RapZ [Bryobacteraceae bacterium]
MANKSAPVKKRRATDRPAELVIITGLSGSGKGSVLKSLEDLGYYAVDNLPVDLIPKFAELTQDSATVRAAALVVDVREGEGLKRFPDIYTRIRNHVKTRLVFLEADDNAILRRFSETRRPHPLGTDNTIAKSIKSERRQLAPIRAMADLIINTSKFTVHELRDFIRESFRGDRDESKIMVYVTSFGYRHGLPVDSDLVFDVRFLPNPNYIPRFKKLTGRHPQVAKYIRSFPQTVEFI